jgi:dehydrogenase/reductase SDR family member 4
VAIEEQRQKLLKTTIERFGQVHFLVNNAGINPIFGDLMDVDEKAWDKLFEVNVKAGFLMSKLFAPEIEKSG